MDPKTSWIKTISVKKNLVQKILGQKETLGPKIIFGFKNILVKKSKVKKIKAPKNLVQKVWSRSVKTGIFLIWTNVARTNGAWTNVTVTFGIC